MVKGRAFTSSIGNFKPILESTGYEDIHYEIYKIPVGTWPADKRQKEMGAYLLLNAETGFDAIGTALFTRELGMDKDKAREIVDGAWRDVKNRKIHTYSTQ